MLHSNNNTVKESAKKEYIQCINKVMSVTHRDFTLDDTATCNKCTTSGNVDKIYKNRETAGDCRNRAIHQPLRDARNIAKCHDINGKVMQCINCG